MQHVWGSFTKMHYINSLLLLLLLLIVCLQTCVKIGIFTSIQNSEVLQPTTS